MTRRRPRCGRAAFTLLEVIVAVALVVSVIAVLLVGSAAVMGSFERLEKHSRTFQDVLVLDRTVDTIFSNIVPFTWPGEDGEETPVFSGQPDAMTLAYIHAFNRLDDGALRFCAVVREDDELVVYHRNRPPVPDPPDGPTMQRTVLSTGVDAVEFRYADLVDKQVEFVSDWEDRTYLPLAVWLRVRWKNGTHEDWLRRTAGSSYRERWGRWVQDRDE